MYIPKKSNKSLKIQAISIFVGQVLSFVIQFLTPVILVRILSKNDYGVFQQFNLLALTFIPILGLGLNSSLFYYYPISNDKDKSAFVTQTFLILFFVGLIFLGLIIWIGDDFFNYSNMHNLRGLSLYLGVFVLCMVITSLSDSIFILENNLKLNVLYPPLDKLVRVVCIVGFWLYYNDFLLCIIGLVAYSIIRLIFITFYVNKNYNLKFKCSIRKETLKSQLSYSFPVLSFVILSTVMTRFDKYLISFNVSPEEYAVYVIAFLSVPLLNQFYSSVQSSIVPEMAKYAYSENITGVKSLWHNAFNKTVSVTVPALIYFILVAEELITFLYSDSYISSVSYYRFCILGLLLVMTNHGMVLRSFKKTKEIFLCNLASASICIPLGYVLINSYKLYGGVAISLISLALSTSFVLNLERKQLRLSFRKMLPWITFFKVIACSALPIPLIYLCKYVFTSKLVFLLSSSLTYFVIVSIIEYKVNVFPVPEIFTKLNVIFIKKDKRYL